MMKMKSNCIAISNKLAAANNENCEGSYSVTSAEQCNTYDSYKLSTCGWIKCFFAWLLSFISYLLFVGLGIAFIAIAIPKVADWFDENVGGFIRKLTGTDTKFEIIAEDQTSDEDSK